MLVTLCRPTPYHQPWYLGVLRDLVNNLLQSLMRSDVFIEGYACSKHGQRWVCDCILLRLEVLAKRVTGGVEHSQACDNKNKCEARVVAMWPVTESRFDMNT
jgi:hypothetical protein